MGDRMHARPLRQVAFATPDGTSSQSHDIENSDRPRALVPLAHDAFDDDSRQQVSAPLATHQKLAAQVELFAQNGEAPFYYFVVTGKLLAVRHCPPSNPAVRFLTAGDLFILDCDGAHTASCYTVVDSQVLRLHRQQMTELAQRDPELTQFLHAVHDAELEMILQPPGRNAVAGFAQQPSSSGASIASFEADDYHSSHGGWDGTGDRAPDEAGICGLGRSSA